MDGLLTLYVPDVDTHDAHAHVSSYPAHREAVPTPSVDVEEVDVHVNLDGEWHRELTHRETACEKRLAITGLWRRPKKYDATDGAYCPICFSKREIREANAMKAATAEVEREFDDEWLSVDWRERNRIEKKQDTERTRRISERLEQKLILAEPTKKDDTP